MRSPRPQAATALLAWALLTGCAGGGDPPPPPERAERREAPERPRLTPARCPAAMANCREASGRVVFVEAVDPDGDGDAHLVLAGRRGVSGPGITAVDVKRSLRPDPLPALGDRVSAAGPVYEGSYGQRQIEAVELHVARR